MIATVLHSMCQQICKTQQWPQDWKRSVFILTPKAVPKNAQTTAQLHSSHMLAKKCSKFSKPGFNSMWTVNFQMFKLDLEKAEEPEIKLPTFRWVIQKQESSRKNIHFCFIDYAKAFDCMDHNKLENFSRNRNTRPPYLPPEKSVWRSGSNS